VKILYGLAAVLALITLSTLAFREPAPEAASSPTTVGSEAQPTTSGEIDAGPRGDARPGAGSVDVMPVIPGDIYDPVAAGEPTPPDFRQVLPRDAILPVYVPRFVPAVEARWNDETLIMGLELDGESKAYPVSFLTRREMVIDWIAGTPILVSW